MVPVPVTEGVPEGVAVRVVVVLGVLAGVPVPVCFWVGV